jgi:hypothetical protein
MFQDIVNVVKEHFAEHPEVSQHIPPEKRDDVYNEVATQVAGHLPASGAQGEKHEGLFDKIKHAFGSGHADPAAAAIEGGLVASLASKFGLPPAATGAIAGALPGLLQKLMNRHVTA